MALTSAVWSGDPDYVPPPTMVDLETALAMALNDSTGSGSGSIGWTFNIQDQALDFFSAGETLTATYDVTVFDGTTSSTQTVTITMTGAHDDAIVVNSVRAGILDAPATDDGQVVAVGDLLTGDSAGDLGNGLSVTDVNGQPVGGSLDIAGAYGTSRCLAAETMSTSPTQPSMPFCWDKIRPSNSTSRSATISVTARQRR